MHVTQWQQQNRNRLTVELLENRTLLDAGFTPNLANQSFVAHLYQDLLGRLAEPSGLSGWAEALDSGQATRAQVVMGIENSLEYRARVIQILYGQYFHRTADPAGLASWTGYLASGGRYDGLRSNLLASDEYYQLHGRDNASLVKAVYRDVLAREADAAGAQGWIQFLAEGASHTTFAAAIVDSAESAQNEVQELYRELLHRDADSAGLSSFSMAMGSGVSSEQIASFIASSDEYFARQ